MQHPRKGNSKKPHDRARKIVALRRKVGRTPIEKCGAIVRGSLFQELSR